MTTRTEEAPAVEVAPAIHITMIGPVAFATPTPKPCLTETQGKWIERAILLASEGNIGGVELQVRKVERMIWPRGFDPHHEARVRATAEALKARQAMPEPEEGPVEATVLPDDERGLPASDIARFDKAMADLSSPTRLLKAEQRVERRRIIARIEATARDAAENRELQARQAETEALAIGRGEAVETTKTGARMIADHDPLLNLFRCGALTEKQLDAGHAIRELYDLRMGDAASVAFDGMPAGSHNHEAFVLNRLTRAKTTIPVGQLETALLNGRFRTVDGALHIVKCWPDLKAAGLEPHVSLKVLRWVCCEHHTLTSMGRGRAYDRNRNALRWALDVADEVLDGRAATS